MFSSNKIDDLDVVSRFFWGLNRQEMKEEHVEKILCFWNECVDWINDIDELPQNFLSNLGRLGSYITEISDREFKLLMASAPYVNVGYNADSFIHDLIRLAEQISRKG